MQNSMGLCRPLCRTVWGCAGLCAEQYGTVQAFVQNSMGLYGPLSADKHLSANKDRQWNLSITCGRKEPDHKVVEERN